MATSRLLFLLLLTSACGLPSQGGKVVEKSRPANKSANAAAHPHVDCTKAALHGEPKPDDQNANRPVEPSSPTKPHPDVSHPPTPGAQSTMPPSKPSPDCENHPHTLR